MTSGEARNNQPDFPIEEAAPIIDTYWSSDPPEPFHVSELEPDPEAKMELGNWARLYYQMFHLSLRDETPAIGVIPESDTAVSVHFPVIGVYAGNTPVTWLSMGMGSALKNESRGVVGWRTMGLTFDLKRPGVVSATDTYVTLPAALPEHASMEAATEPEELKGTYMAADGSSVAFRQLKYEIGDDGAEQLIGILRGVSPLHTSEEEILEGKFDLALEQMCDGLREACERYFDLGKNLIRDPEELLRNQWAWRLPRVQHSFQRREVLHAWLPERYVIYAPPGVRASDSDMTQEFFEARENPGWSRTEWDESKLPDDYDPLFDSPTSVIEIPVEEILAEIPEEQHIYLARYYAQWLRGLETRISIRLGSVNVGPSEVPIEDFQAKHAEIAAEYERLFPDIAAAYPPTNLKSWETLIKQDIAAALPESELEAALESVRGELPPLPGQEQE